MRASARLVLLAATASIGACGPTVDVSKALQVSEVTTGWHDAGVVEGKNKLVPSIAFKLTNTSTEPLAALQVNAIFRRMGETEEWGSGWVAVTKSGALGPGEATPLLTVNSQRGYTGTESRQDLLKNRNFVDARVEIFAKYGSAQWKRVSELQVDRQLKDR